MNIYKRFEKLKEKLMDAHSELLFKEIDELFAKVKTLHPTVNEYFAYNALWRIECDCPKVKTRNGRDQCLCDVYQEAANDWVFGGDDIEKVGKVTISFLKSWVADWKESIDNGYEADKIEYETINRLPDFKKMRDIVELFSQIEQRITLWWDAK